MLTIAAPNTDRSLLTLPELRSAVGVSDTSRDTELSALGGYIAAAITRACKVATAGATPPTLRLETVTETFRPTIGQAALFLARKPVVSITSASEDGSSLTSDEYENDGHGLYRLTSDERLDWVAGQHVIEYSAGWATVPDDLKFAAIRFVQAEWQQGSRDPLLKRIHIEGVSEREYWVDPTKDSVVPAEVMDILDRGGYINKLGWMR